MIYGRINSAIFIKVRANVDPSISLFLIVQKIDGRINSELFVKVRTNVDPSIS